jgi:hypothetical protein
MVLPMTATQKKPEPLRLSEEEAEELRALLHSTLVAEMDALARFRAGGLRPGKLSQDCARSHSNRASVGS